MGRFFLDTSALVKRYRVEVGTEVVDQLFSQASAEFWISRLSVVEVVSALALRVRTGELSMADYQLARARFLGDIATKALQVVRPLAIHYHRAELLIDQFAPSRRLRTLDALQLGVALHLATQDPIDAFLCADQSLCEIAVLQGLPTVNPASVP